ncbi:MAG: hypothetical protein H0X29_10725 [Parachlamydiaceae bacterium]|nr:hypothetical protein [Parachlamydiaceae bacterium]
MSTLSINFSGLKSFPKGIEPTSLQINSKKHQPFHIKPSFNQIEKVWEYIDSGLGVCNNIMNTLLQSKNWLTTKGDKVLKKITYQIGLIGIVNLPINISYILQKFRKFGIELI